MIVIENCILSDALFENCFCCDIKKCKGICCIEGDAGAPLERAEIHIIEKEWEKIKPFMTPVGIQTVEQSGVFTYDTERNTCTPLNNGKECAFMIEEDSIAKCAIEKAWEQKVISFQKPVSCHLYPIRIVDYGEFMALNYDEWSICCDAKKKGLQEQIPIYAFLKTPLIRKFGELWYRELEKQVDLIKKKTKS